MGFKRITHSYTLETGMLRCSELDLIPGIPMTGSVTLEIGGTHRSNRLTIQQLR